jgi:hypothetical protein
MSRIAETCGHSPRATSAFGPSTDPSVPEARRATPIFSAFEESLTHTRATDRMLTPNVESEPPGAARNDTKAPVQLRVRTVVVDEALVGLGCRRRRADRAHESGDRLELTSVHDLVRL